MSKWKKVKIPGYSHYQISNDGLLLNTKNGTATHGHFVKGPLSSLEFSLSSNNKELNIVAHNLVAMHFKDNEVDKNYAIHLDYNKTNNIYTNLELADFGQVLSHARRLANQKRAKVRGVYPFKKCSKKPWRAVVTLGRGKTKTVGYFKTKEEAIVAYKNKYKALYGVDPY